MKRHRHQGRQRGYALLELALVLLIASLIAVFGARTLANRLDDAQAQSAAAWMESIHKALLSYVRLHGPAIQEAVSPAALAAQGFMDWRAPTLAELKHAGILSVGMPEATRLTGMARLNVWRRGACPGDGCVVEGLVHGERPLRTAAGDQVDEAMVAQWLLAAKGEGAAVHARDPERIRGAAFAFSSSLPDGLTLPVGTVGMAVTAAHQALWSFLRVGDPRNPDFQGPLSVAGALHGGQDATLGGMLVLGATALDGQGCAVENAVAHEDHGGLLVCRQGRWRSSSRMAGGYSYNFPHGCQLSDGKRSGNPITGSCSCPWYATAVPILDNGRSHLDPEGRQVAYLCMG